MCILEKGKYIKVLRFSETLLIKLFMMAFCVTLIIPALAFTELQFEKINLFGKTSNYHFV